MKESVKRDMLQRMRNVADSLFKKNYLAAVEEVEEELNLNLVFGQSDQNALDFLRSNPRFIQALQGVSTLVTQQVEGIINDAFLNPEGLSSRDVAQKIRLVADVADARSELIARTEIGRVAAAARKASYEKAMNDGEREFLFEHAGPSDSRTTSCCSRIKQRTSGGVPLKDYIRIMKEESSRDFPDWSVDEAAPLAHYQCRHVMLRVRG